MRNVYVAMKLQQLQLLQRGGTSRAFEPNIGFTIQYLSLPSRREAMRATLLLVLVLLCTGCKTAEFAFTYPTAGLQFVARLEAKDVPAQNAGAGISSPVVVAQRQPDPVAQSSTLMVER